MSGPVRRWRTALAAGAATAAVDAADGAEGVPEQWRRENYRGRTVDLRGGVALVSGLATAVLRSGGVAAGPLGPVAAIGLAAGAGLWDDLKGDGSVRGLKGHLRRLRQGQVTTGLVKLVAVTAGAAVFAVTAELSRSRRASWAGSAARITVDAALVAGAANLINLLDLRPGRALKAAGAPAVLLAVAPGGGGELAAGVAGAVAAAAPADLGERTMLGDCGANALGAAVGVALAQSLRPGARAVAALAVAGLILASEKVSFSEVIAATPALRRLDEWGRREDGGA
ncbi:MAG: hypothetical protein LBC97_02115 [Bifidobacteriaceae bacterium]|jgi:hypothetical protein|nr:hypothetical protein [Bifidobacteriaceae bacterium]